MLHQHFSFVCQTSCIVVLRDPCLCPRWLRSFPIARSCRLHADDIDMLLCGTPRWTVDTTWQTLLTYLSSFVEHHALHFVMTLSCWPACHDNFFSDICLYVGIIHRPKYMCTHVLWAADWSILASTWIMSAHSEFRSSVHLLAYKASAKFQPIVLSDSWQTRRHTNLILIFWAMHQHITMTGLAHNHHNVKAIAWEERRHQTARRNHSKYRCGLPRRDSASHCLQMLHDITDPWQLCS